MSFLSGTLNPSSYVKQTSPVKLIRFDFTQKKGEYLRIFTFFYVMYYNKNYFPSNAERICAL